MVEHILSLYILLRGVPNLTQTDWAISIIWLRYIMPKNFTRFQCQSTALVTTRLLTWMSETNEILQAKHFVFFTYYTVRAATLQNDVIWCYEKNFCIFLIIFQKHVQPNGWFGTQRLIVTPFFEMDITMHY